MPYGLNESQLIVRPSVLTKLLPVLEETKIFNTESATHHAGACRPIFCFNSTCLDSDENPTFYLIFCNQAGSSAGFTVFKNITLSGWLQAASRPLFPKAELLDD